MKTKKGRSCRLAASTKRRRARIWTGPVFSAGERPRIENPLHVKECRYPAVTLADASQGGIGWSDAPAYIVAQVLGAFIGVGAAHLMFGEAFIQISHHARAGGGQLFSEFVATFGLLCVI